MEAHLISLPLLSLAYSISWVKGTYSTPNYPGYLKTYVWLARNSGSKIKMAAKK